MMENDISGKIRLLLNEISILNQPENAGGKFIYQLDTLNRMKVLSAEIYLLSDSLLSGRTLPSQLAFTDNQQISVAPVHPAVEAAPESIVPEPEMPLTQSENLVLPEINLPPATHEPEWVEPETIITPEPTEEAVTRLFQPPAPPVPPATEIPKTDSPSHTGNDLGSKISLTRRFEYINNLFAGDGAAFSAFLQKLSAAGSNENAMQIFDQESESRNWKRRGETAADLKALLRKLL